MKAIIPILFMTLCYCAKGGESSTSSVAQSQAERAIIKEEYYLASVETITISMGSEKIRVNDALGVFVVKPKTVIIHGSGARALLKEIGKDHIIAKWTVIDPVGSPYLCWISVEDAEGKEIDAFPCDSYGEQKFPLLTWVIKTTEPERMSLYLAEQERFVKGFIMKGKTELTRQ